MLFRCKYYLQRFWYNLAARLAVIGPLWLVLILSMHQYFNMEDSNRKQITMGYMPVITNLSSPILDYASLEGDGIRFKALKFASFAEMGEALRHGQIDAAFIIAPLAIQLRQQGEDIKVVYIGNRHESTMVARSDLEVNSIYDLVDKTVAVPIRFSGHNLSIMRLIEENNLEGRINIVEMNPPDMAAALATGSLDAYYVGEPFPAQTLKSGDAQLVHYVEDVWDGFICNLVMVRQDLIDSDPEAVKALVEGAARSGLWAQSNPKEAAVIAAKYWNQDIKLVEYAMSTPNDRILFEKFVPQKEEMQYMADLMHHFGLIESSKITGLIDDSFARDANLQDIKGLESII